MSGSGQIDIYALDNSSKIQIVVHDHGPGVSSTVRDRLFTQKISSKGDKGTGIGLYEARNTLRKYKGDLALEESSFGARFVANFVSPEQFADEFSVEKLVIVVEGDPNIRNLWSSILTAIGCEVLLFTEVDEFLNYQHQNSYKFDKNCTLITDLIFDGYEKTGFDLLAKFQNKAQLIMCTSLSDNNDIKRISDNYGAKLLSKDTFSKNKITIR